MIGRLALAFGMIAIAVAMFPLVTQTLQDSQANISATPSSISGSLVSFLDLAPWLVGAAFLAIILMVVISAFRSSGGGVDGGSDDDEEDEDTEEDEEEEEEIEEEDEEEDEPVKEKPKRSTIVTTTKRTGEKKTNVKLSAGYNVDKYTLEPVKETKLTMKEENFKKTRFD